MSPRHDRASENGFGPCSQLADYLPASSNISGFQRLDSAFSVDTGEAEGLHADRRSAGRARRNPARRGAQARTMAPLTPLSSEGGSQYRRQLRQLRPPFCRSFSSGWSRSSLLSSFQRASRGIARVRECLLVPKCTRLVPAETQNLAAAGNTTCPFAGLLVKTSDGLEPSTPSIPWRFWGGTGWHGRASADTFVLQIRPSRCVLRARARPG
jgi:hypothetical protein